MKLSTRMLIFFGGIALHGVVAAAGLVIGVGMGAHQDPSEFLWRDLPQGLGCGMIVGVWPGLLFSGLVASTAPDKRGVRWVLLGGSSLALFLVVLPGGYYMGCAAGC